MAEKSLAEEIKELITLGISPNEACTLVSEERAQGKTVVTFIYRLILRCV